jgi:hypothetical protein
MSATKADVANAADATRTDLYHCMNDQAADDTRDVEHGEPSDDIERIEAQLEQLAGVLERCRKVGLFAKTILASGGLILLAVFLGLLVATPLAVLGSLALLVGGTVLYGSNYGTLQHTTAAIARAELARIKLIDGRELRLVPAGNGHMPGGPRLSASSENF